MTADRFKKILRLFLDIGVRIGITSGREYPQRYPILATAKKNFPKSRLLSELESFPELLAFKADLQAKNSIFFMILIENQDEENERIKTVQEFSETSNISQILVLYVDQGTEVTNIDHLLNNINGFWVKDNVRKPLKELLDISAKPRPPRRPQRKRAA